MTRSVLDVATPGEKYCFLTGSACFSGEKLSTFVKNDNDAKRIFADPFRSARGSINMDLSDLNDALSPATLEERLAIAAHLPGRVVFTTSFGLEDQAITHAIHASGAAIDILTLDTGRLFPETYELWSRTEQRYGIRIVAHMPERTKLERYVAQNGIDGFRNSVELRKACCGIRKVEPLGRALDGAVAWVTGLRAEQSDSRGGTPLAEIDPAFGLIKLNPLADWRRGKLEAYVALHQVSYNPLHDRGFASIGCAPCTRAVNIGEPERAGRWWWEEDDKKECGLHLHPVAAASSQIPSLVGEVKELA